MIMRRAMFTARLCKTGFFLVLVSLMGGLAWQDDSALACGFGYRVSSEVTQAPQDTALLATSEVAEPAPSIKTTIRDMEMSPEMSLEPIYMMPALAQEQDEAPPMLTEDEPPLVRQAPDEPLAVPDAQEGASESEPSEETPDPASSSLEESSQTISDTEAPVTPSSSQEADAPVLQVPPPTCTSLTQPMSPEKGMDLKALITSQQTTWQSYLPLVKKTSPSLQTLFYLWQYGQKPTDETLVHTLLATGKKWTATEWMAFYTVAPHPALKARVDQKLAQHPWLQPHGKHHGSKQSVQALMVSLARQDNPALLESFDVHLQALSQVKKLTVTETFLLTTLAAKSCRAESYAEWKAKYMEAFKQAVRRSKFKY